MLDELIHAQSLSQMHSVTYKRKQKNITAVKGCKLNTYSSSVPVEVKPYHHQHHHKQIRPLERRGSETENMKLWSTGQPMYMISRAIYRCDRNIHFLLAKICTRIEIELNRKTVLTAPNQQSTRSQLKQRENLFNISFLFYCNVPVHRYYFLNQLTFPFTVTADDFVIYWVNYHVNHFSWFYRQVFITKLLYRQ